MRFKLMILLVFMPTVAFASYTIRIDKDLDYYESLSDSGVTVPMTYQASPTAETIRDALITAGLMDPAPVIVTYSDIVHEDRATIAHTDRTGIAHEDHLQ